MSKTFIIEVQSKRAKNEGAAHHKSGTADFAGGSIPRRFAAICKFAGKAELRLLCENITVRGRRELKTGAMK